MPNGSELLVLAAPVVLLATGLLPPRVLERAPLRGGRLVGGAGLLALAAALAAALAGAFPTSWAAALPAGLVRADGVTLVILPLVALLTTIVAAYSRSYLAGERRQGHFFRWLALTAGGFMVVVVAGDLALFAAAIIFTGSGLHRLLTYYGERLPAQMVAHKKLLFSRVADACLVTAALLASASIGDTSFDAINAAATAGEGPGLQLGLAAWLIVAYAILKSGQFPFHGWLLQVMEAPTPVSALLHAGIVYSGALAVLRTHELLLAEGHALILLAVVGLMTAALASLAMLTQTAIKSSLAWSTAGQLGFMLLELGLGLFVLALLHLVAHSLYKAHAFLSSGSIVDLLRAPGAGKPPGGLGTPGWLATVVGAAVVAFGVAALWGITVGHEPALLALGTILAAALTQLLVPARVAGLSLARVAPLGVAVAVAYFALHSLFAAAFSDTLAPIPERAGAAEWALLTLTAVVFLGLSWLQAVAIHRPAGPLLRRLYVHLYNGLYTDLPVERLVYRVWPARFRGAQGGGE
ncbi:MAG: proton-conducting transporter membrane subunit [Pseudomonadota bacterium]